MRESPSLCILRSIQDLPRARREIRNAGAALTSALASALAAQCEEPFAVLFSPEWDGGREGSVVASAAGMAARRLDEARPLLAPPHFERLTGLALVHIEEQYLQVGVTGEMGEGREVGAASLPFAGPSAAPAESCSID